MKWITTKQFLAIGLLTAVGSAQAEDIDLFFKVDLSGAKTNVVFVLDNAAAFSSNAASCKYADGTAPSLDGTSGGIEQCALYNVIDALPPARDSNGNIIYGADGTPELAVNIGFVAYNAQNIRDISNTHCGGSGATGGCVMVPLTDDRKVLKDWVKTWRTSGASGNGYIKANSGATAAAMQETWAYYTGNTGLSGRTYPGVAATCQKNYVIFIGNAYGANGTPGDGDAVAEALSSAPGVTAAQTTLMAGTYQTTCGPTTFSTNVSTHQNNGLYADEWARYMKQNSSLFTYTVGFVDPKSCKADYPALLKNMAEVGAEDDKPPKYFEVTTYDELSLALNKALTDIFEVDSVFASAGLPASANSQGSFLNQVFMGMFRPSTSPRWGGNLKQYKFQASVAAGGGYSLDLVDANGDAAINSAGAISECARSFWTPAWTPAVPDNVDNYWNFKGSLAKGTCSADTVWSNTPDGNVVEKGAAAYVLRKMADRFVYTCDNSNCTELTQFGSATDLDKWTRGFDVLDENGNGVKNEMRPSALGDVVHSTPVAVDYGGDTVVVYYGANDGMLHAVNGNQTGVDAGKEKWSFVAPEQYSRLQRIYDNNVQIPFPSNGGANSKPYFFDGPITGYQDGQDVWIYASQRRGGRMMYAFDVSTPSNPPTLMWRKGCTTALGDDSGCQTGFDGMAQTWSAPKTLKAEGYESGEKPLLIMGAGYDTCEDAEPNTCTAPKGNKVYVMDAESGVLKKTFTTIRSVAADVTVVPNQVTGMADFAYVADTGGNVYRIAIGAEAPADWTMTKIAALGCDAPPCGVGGVLNRKFLFAPEVVVTPSFIAVLIGSGDREQPLITDKATEVSNAFFMLKDKPWETNWLSDESDNCVEETLCLKSLWGMSNINPNPTQAQLDATKGWYITLSQTEQVVTSPLVLFGVVTYSTHMPEVSDPNSCGSNLGVARVYNQYYLTGAAEGGGSPFAKFKGGGLPPSPVSGMVTVENPTTGDPMTVPFIVGANPESPLEVTLKTGLSGVAGNKERVYWYIQQ